MIKCCGNCKYYDNTVVYIYHVRFDGLCNEKDELVFDANPWCLSYQSKKSINNTSQCGTEGGE
jgi:hypothetical protein